MNGMEARRAEEILEAVFAEAESGHSDVGSVLSRLGDHAPGSGAEDFRTLSGMGLVRVDGDQVTLTEDGNARARGVVRRHRLAERLFRDLLDLSEGVAESQACEFEHILSPRRPTRSVPCSGTRPPVLTESRSRRETAAVPPIAASSPW